MFPDSPNDDDPPITIDSNYLFGVITCEETNGIFIKKPLYKTYQEQSQN